KQGAELELEFEVHKAALGMRVKHPAVGELAEGTFDPGGVDARASRIVGHQRRARHEAFVPWPEADRELGQQRIAVTPADAACLAPGQELGIASNIGYQIEELHWCMPNDAMLDMAHRHAWLTLSIGGLAPL